MSNSAVIPEFGRRYQILNLLGTGGMGAVYRTLDRLSGKVLALKHVRIAPEQLRFASQGNSQDLRLALAHEFKTLASLRHPHIVSVLDYGFDSQGNPFFTMNLLEDAQTLLEAGKQQSLEIQYGLLVQVLQALLYLHRRGIVHRDLKPSNVLVVNGQVKVLDFGLSIAQGEAAETSGTLAYMAPEVLEGRAASPASDLYAFGIMAYELFVGRHPFQVERLNLLIAEIINRPPDMSAFGQMSKLGSLVERLLAKEAEERQESAAVVLAELSSITGQQFPIETALIRESFLQAARFVGRETEFASLRAALNRLTNGQGSLWLIGGESGIGKSRLLDELRTVALVEGVLVLRGQAISEGGSSYLLWRELLKPLCLQTDLSDLEKSVLKVLLPEIGTLLGQAVADAPELDAQASNERLLQVIGDVFSRQQVPILVILEDLQWAGSESITLLKRLSLELERQSLLFVASYRSDEQAQLPAEFPNSQTLLLKRLSTDGIAELSVSILGEKLGRAKYITELLTKETEGNVFFVVEVLRVLAEESGQLDQISSQALPERVFSGGMKSLVQRRLRRLPDWAQTPLQVAAVIGRQLDPYLLASIENSVALDDWLSICADASVVELHEGEWRFAHDKLREGILFDLSKERRTELHRLAAQGIEKVYPDERNFAAALTEHWAAAGDRLKELEYAGLAGEQAATIGAYVEATRFLERANTLLEQIPTSKTQFVRLRFLLGMSYSWLGESDKALKHLQDALQKSGYSYPQNHREMILKLLGSLFLETINRFQRNILKKTPRSSAETDLYGTLAQACELIAEIMYFTNQPLGLLYFTLLSTRLAETVAPAYQHQLARSFAGLMLVAGGIPLHAVARYYRGLSRKALETSQDLGAVVWARELFGIYAMGDANWTEGLTELRSSIQLADEIGDTRRWSESQYMVSVGMILQGSWDKAQEIAQELYTRNVRYADKQLQGVSLTCLGFVLSYRENGERSSALLEQAHNLIEQAHDPSGVTAALGGRAQNAMRMGRKESAKKLLQTFLAIPGVATPTAWYVASGYWGVAETALALLELERSQDHLDLAKKALRLLSGYARSYRCGQPFALVHLSWMAWLDKKNLKAIGIAQRAILSAQQKSMPYAQALAHYHLGRHLSDVDSRRKHHLEQAATLFESLGAAYDLANTRSLLY